MDDIDESKETLIESAKILEDINKKSHSTE